MIEEKLEKSLYLGVSLVLNLIMFTLLAWYLSVRIEPRNTQMEVFLLEVPEIPEIREVKEVRLTSDKNGSNVGQKVGGGISEKGSDLVSSSPMEVSRNRGDIQVPADKSKEEEPSLLKEIEKRVQGKQRDIESGGGVRDSDIGNITAVVSSDGIGFSGGGRATSYIPPFPKISSDEPLSPLRIRIWIDPSGVVSRVQIVQKSGSPQVDQKMVEFVRGIRFEAIGENVIQTGIITFRFKGG